MQKPARRVCPPLWRGAEGVSLSLSLSLFPSAGLDAEGGTFDPTCNLGPKWLPEACAGRWSAWKASTQTGLTAVRDSLSSTEDQHRPSWDPELRSAPSPRFSRAGVSLPAKCKPRQVPVRAQTAPNKHSLPAPENAGQGLFSGSKRPPDLGQAPQGRFPVLHHPPGTPAASIPPAQGRAPWLWASDPASFLLSFPSRPSLSPNLQKLPGAVAVFIHLAFTFLLQWEIL